MQKSGASREHKEIGNFDKYIKPVAISCFWGTIVAVGFLLLFAFILTLRDIPLVLINPLAVLAVALGSFTAGFCCAKLIGQKGMWWGCVCGAILFCLLFLTSLAYSGDIGLMALTKLIIVLACSMIGGVIGVNSRKRCR